MKPVVTVTKDQVPQLMAAVRRLTLQQVMVGVPSTTADRQDGPVNNAQIGYIQEFGSPAANIPARPFLVPGVAAAHQQIVDRLAGGAQAVLRGQTDTADRALHAAGMAARNSVVRKITTGPFAPLAPATIAARWNRIKANRGSPVAPSFAASAKPLVDTGALRAAITYVLRRRGG